MSKWICTIFEGIAGLVIWSFVGWWTAYLLLMITDASAKLSGEAGLIILVATAAVAGLVMALVYARRAYDAYEGRGKPERTAFGNVYSAMVFVLCALAWSVFIFLMQIPKGGH